MTKIQNLKRFEHWILKFGIYLLFGYCDLVLLDQRLDILFNFFYLYVGNAPSTTRTAGADALN